MLTDDQRARIEAATRRQAVKCLKQIEAGLAEIDECLAAPSLEVQERLAMLEARKVAKEGRR